MQLRERVELALAGVRMDAPVQRSKGAGPSDDGHLALDGGNAAIPVNPDSPFSISAGRLRRGVIDLGIEALPSVRPKSYDLTTADGIPYHQIALLHGLREEDLIEGVIPTHPLDVQDALIHYARKGAIINSTYMR